MYKEIILRMNEGKKASEMQKSVYLQGTSFFITTAASVRKRSAFVLFFKKVN